MKKTLALALAATTALSSAAFAEEITEFRIGILGGENAQDRMNSNECYRAKAEELHGMDEFSELYEQALKVKLNETERVAYALALDMES